MAVLSADEDGDRMQEQEDAAAPALFAQPAAVSNNHYGCNWNVVQSDGGARAAMLQWRN